MSDILPNPLNPEGKSATDAEARGKARVQLLETEQWLTRLTESPDFQRYLEFVRAGADATAEQAGNITGHTTEQGYALSQRFFGLKAMHEWPAKQLAALRAQICALDRQG